MDLQAGQAEGQEVPQMDPQASQIDPQAAQQDPQAEGQIDPEQAQNEPQTQIDPEEHNQAMEQLKNALKQEGYTPAQIDYMCHGHVAPPVDVQADTQKSLGEQKLSAEKALHEHKIGHEQRMKDLEYKHASIAKDPTAEVEHKKAIMALELEAKKIEVEKQKVLHEIEIQQRKLEMEQKLKHADESHSSKINSAK